MVTLTPPSPSFSSRAACPRLVCSCGTDVLFPGSLGKRTCWKCGTSLSRPTLLDEPGELSQTFEPQTQSRGASVVARANSWHPSTPTQAERQELWALRERTPSAMERLFRMQGAAHDVVKNHRKDPLHSEVHLGSRMNLLVLAIALNIGVFFWQMQASAVQDTVAFADDGIHNFVDDDGDGVPNHRDKCTKSSHTGWLSGPANDRDSDGCADVVEDDDDDNDGILDVHDKCPFTPHEFGYEANVRRDFDMDGCVDIMEDTDDDDDGVHDSADTCPHSISGEQSDHEGCTQSQRDNLANATNNSLVQSSQPDEDDAKSGWSDTLFNVGLQFFLGGILSEIIGRSEEFVEAFWAVAAAPGDAVRRYTLLSPEAMKRISLEMENHKDTWKTILKKHGIRFICYLAVFMYLRQNRCRLSSASSWLSFGMQTFFGGCPA